MCAPQSEVSQRQHTKAQEEMSDRGRKKNREEQQARFYRTSNCAMFTTRHHLPRKSNARRNVSSQNGLPGLGIWQAYSVVSGAVYDTATGACMRSHDQRMK